VHRSSRRGAKSVRFAVIAVIYVSESRVKVAIDIHYLRRVVVRPSSAARAAEKSRPAQSRYPRSYPARMAEEAAAVSGEKEAATGRRSTEIHRDKSNRERPLYEILSLLWRVAENYGEDRWRCVKSSSLSLSLSLSRSLARSLLRAASL